MNVQPLHDLFVRPRAEGTRVPEGVSCTETEKAYYLRIREAYKYVTIKILKGSLDVIVDKAKEIIDE